MIENSTGTTNEANQDANDPKKKLGGQIEPKKADYSTDSDQLWYKTKVPLKDDLKHKPPFPQIPSMIISAIMLSYFGTTDEVCQML